jgi:hypothetical protein
MKNANAFMLFIAMFVLINVVYAGEFEITGYQSDMYILDDMQKKQLIENVIAVISGELSSLKNKVGKNDRIELIITTVGYADQNGLKKKNQTLGQDRAEQIRQRLFEKFPEAKFPAYSEGDREDVKKVVVSWKFSVQPMADIGKQNILIPKPSSKSVLLLIGFLALFLLIAFIFIGLIIIKTRKLPIMPAKTDSQRVPKDVSSWDVEVSFPRRFFSPKNYLVSIVACNERGVWSSLIPQMGEDGCLFHFDPNALRRTLIGCSSPQRIKFYRPIFKKLAKKGVIKIKTKN